MDDTQQMLELLKHTVDTARQEIELAIMFHETWRPAAYDTDLHDRIGTSYAAHSFQIIRMSLRRELILALIRLWDNNRAAVRMSKIAHQLREPEFFEALVQMRSELSGLRSGFALDAIKEALTLKRDQALNLINKYSVGGSAYEVLEKLKDLRHKRLAHRQMPNTPIAAVGSEVTEQIGEDSERLVLATDDEIETFYQDNLEIMRLLLSLVQGLAFDLSEATKVYKHHAKFFWASARGERTEGHPNYRPQSL